MRRQNLAMLIKEIFKSFNEIIPTENAAEWDNSGEQIQFSNEVVNFYPYLQKVAIYVLLFLLESQTLVNQF